MGKIEEMGKIDGIGKKKRSERRKAAGLGSNTEQAWMRTS